MAVVMWVVNSYIILLGLLSLILLLVDKQSLSNARGKEDRLHRLRKGRDSDSQEAGDNEER